MFKYIMSFSLLFYYNLYLRIIVLYFLAYWYNAFYQYAIMGPKIPLLREKKTH